MSVDVTTIRPAVTEAALAGRRLDASDVTALAAATDILTIGALADDVRRRRHGAVTSFVRVHVLDVADGATWTAPPPAAREVRLSGRPESAAVAVELVQRAKALSDGLPLRGFALADLADLGGVPLLAEVRSAGLDEVAFVAPAADAARLVTEARAAGLGVRVVVAMASPDDRASWLLEVRALQDAAGGFDAVAPLARAGDRTSPTTGFDDVRLVALARLALETIPHVQVDWQLHGPKLAQVALTVGADDVDAVAADDDISRGPRRASLEEIRRNIAAAGLTPEERDGRFASLAR